ncbi:MAG: RIO1 family regulatory kinase/ATPase [Halobacteria archaeon]|nr:RIO1 family regulatory kinase/ATPase [Halobacteria archaeon]
MSTFKKFVRGDNSVNTDRLAETLQQHYGYENVDVELVNGDNWLSIPFVVNGEFFVKVITPQNTLTHSFFTGIRNLGTRMSGSGAFFETYDSPREMAEHEFELAQRMQEAGIRSPEPIEVLESGENALLVFEYNDEVVESVFATLRRLHQNRLAHGDFSLENVLVVDEEVYFIDATNIKEEGYDDAVAYDLACALGALASRMNEDRIVEIASGFYTEDEIKHSLDFLVVVRLRPGIEEGFSILRLRQAVNSFF